MAYKKYIRKNGKIYGPYIYHSKRVDGKVVSEYHGSRESALGKLNKVNKRNFIFIFIAVALVLFFTLFLTLKSPNISGNVVLNLESQYQENQPLEGVLTINLNEGEMLPEKSEIIFENAGNSYKYNLSDLVDAEMIEGDFFIQGQDSFGQGLGYGVIGNQRIYPDVYFEFEIVSSGAAGEQDDLSGLSDEESTQEEIIEEPIQEEVIETPVEELIQEEVIEEIVETIETTIEGPVPEEIIGAPEEVVEEPIEVSVEEPVPEQDSETKEEVVEETVEVPEQDSETKEEVVEETVEVPEQSPITGGVISNIFGFIARSFIGLTSTGKSISEEGKIQADVSYTKEFRYSLNSGESIKIVSDSVRTNTKELSVGDLQIFREGNEVVVKTDYYEETFGFGKKYLGEATNGLNINLSSLNFNFNDPNLEIKLIYEDLELKSFKINLGDSFVENLDNASLEDSEALGFSLTNQEKNILNNAFGNISVEQTARSYKDWIIVQFKIGDYEVEYSYNKDLSREELNSLIEKDKINWLKDISKELVTEDTPSFKLDEFNKNSDLS